MESTVLRKLYPECTDDEPHELTNVYSSFDPLPSGAYTLRVVREGKEDYTRSVVLTQRVRLRIIVKLDD